MISPEPLPSSSPPSPGSGGAGTLGNLIGPGRVWLRPTLLLAGGWVGIEALSHALPGESAGILGIGVLAGGWWWFSRRGNRLTPSLPRSLDGWKERCEAVLQQFERLDPTAVASQAVRRADFGRILADRNRDPLTLALVGSAPPPLHYQAALLSALRGSRPLSLRWGHPLPASSSDWRWPAHFESCDLLLFHLRMPLTAADLRWLEALPPGQPVWLLVEAGGRAATVVREDLLRLWPAADPQRLLLWDGSGDGVGTALQPLSRTVHREAERIQAATPLRCLELLHGRWQAELERLRREEWSALQQRTQWLVAAGVIAAPLPSLDLLVLAVANGLMLQEMARLWDSPWTLEQLRAAAGELARAALALGVVEWSSQALLGAIRLHGATWMVGGAIQALSAAYLTRVVGHAMADVLALSAGVSEPDLAEIKRQAPLLVSRAADAERLDWAGFLQQGRTWLDRRGPQFMKTAS